MIFWTGVGIIVPIFAIITFYMGLLIGQIISFGNPYIKVAITGIIMIVGSYLLWKIGKSINSPKKNRVLIDKATNQEVVLKPNHSLFFIKVQYWAIPMAIFGLLVIISSFAKT